MSNKSMKPVAAAIGAAFAGSMLLTGAASADTNPFGLTELNGGYMQIASSHMGGKCGGNMAAPEAAAGKCGGNMAAPEAAAGKCGGNMAAPAVEGKCGAGKCGANMAAPAAAAGKCGGNMAK